MTERTERLRIVDKTLISGWSGAGTKGAEARNHDGMPQHQLSVVADAVPAAGVLRVRGRPRGASGFVMISSALDAIDLTAAGFNGGAFLIFEGYFNAYQLSFSTALSVGRTVSVYLSSSDQLIRGS